MNLFFHNLVESKWIKGVVVGYPLIIKARDIKKIKKNFNKDAIAHIIPRLDWDALYQAADNIGESTGLPKSLAANYKDDEDFLRKVHHVLLEVKVVNGDLICPETGRKFPINNGISNFLLNKDELADHHWSKTTKQAQSF